MASTPVPVVRSTATSRARRAALACLLVAIAGTLVDRPRQAAGPRFTASKGAVLETADSMLRARGEDPVAWRRLTRPSIDTTGLWRALLQREEAESLATVLAGSWAVPAWWTVRYVRTSDAVADRATEWRVRVLPDGRPLDVRHIVPDEMGGASLGPDSARAIARDALRRRGFDLAPLQETQYEANDQVNRRDLTVTYVDTSIVLPGEATARARVTIAGDEVLSVTRGIEIPESFEREFRSESMNSVMAAGLLGMLLLGTVVWTVARTVRRLPARAGSFPKRLARSMLLLLIVVAALDGLQSIPAALAGYPTAKPWDQFISSVAAMQFLNLIAVLLFAALWMLVNGLRRRLAIPISSADPGAATWLDELVLGLGLGAVIPLVSLGFGVLPADGLPAVPTTALENAIPLLARVPRVIMDVVSLVPVVAIPALAIVGAFSGHAARLALRVLVLGLGGGMVLALESTVTSPDPLTVVYAIAAVAIVVLALRAWAGISMVAWVVAASAQAGIEELGRMVHAATTVEQAAAGLGALTAIGLITVVIAWSRRNQSAPGVPSGVSPGSVLGDPAGEATY
jgi:hypothetical protein